MFLNANIFTVKDPEEKLAATDEVKIHPSSEGDFKDYINFLDLFYSDFTRKVKQNHIFGWSIENQIGNHLQCDLHKSNLDKHKMVKHNSFNRNFFGRHNYPKTEQGLKEAIDACPWSIKDYWEEYLKTIKAPSIIIYKQVEMGTNYRGVVPAKKRHDEVYAAPQSDLLEAQKSEKKKRIFQGRLEWVEATANKKWILPGQVP